MGITVIHKSDLSESGWGAKIALVLSGGAVSGGGFKLGGLKALDDILVDRKTTDFDCYVGVSAGAFLAVPLAAGIPPDELMQSLEGTSTRISSFRPEAFYNVNRAELVEGPWRYLVQLGAFLPGALLEAVLGRRDLWEEESPGPLSTYLVRPTRTNLLRLFRSLAEPLLRSRPFPQWRDHLPSAPFDNATIERYVRENLDNVGLPNEFAAFSRRTGRELYVVAVDLDSAERVVFGREANRSLTIAQAVQASTALPGFYRPLQIDGHCYVDGGVRGTSNIDVAVERGAELVICYNPFRPVWNVSSRNGDETRAGAVEDPVSLANRGLFPVLNQSFRILLHSRLQLELHQLRDDPAFRGDVVVIEPTERDVEFFAMNPLAFGRRSQAVQLGYASVSGSLNRHFDELRPIFERYGIRTRRLPVPAMPEAADARRAIPRRHVFPVPAPRPAARIPAIGREAAASRESAEAPPALRIAVPGGS